MALQRQAHLHNAPAQQNQADGPDDGEDEGTEVVDNSQRIALCPVSYTHLDVYKRQTILRLNELIQPSAEWGTLLRNLESMMEQFRNARKLVNSSYYYYETYHPIVEFYLKRLTAP